MEPPSAGTAHIRDSTVKPSGDSWTGDVQTQDPSWADKIIFNLKFRFLQRDNLCMLPELVVWTKCVPQNSYIEDLTPRVMYLEMRPQRE